ncbi:MAG: D-2-hydroxyacid dehydrogenase [Vicinamibacterales bacterium]
MKVLVSIQQPVAQWQIPAEGVATLRARFPHIEFIHATSDEERARGLADCDAAYTWILKASELPSAGRLRWVHTSAVAVETLCLPELFAQGVIVSNTRGVQAVPIAEHTLAVVLALAKQLPLVLEHQRHARWAQNDFMGPRLPWLLRGRTLGLVGVGTIGSEIASRARAFGMRVVALRRRREQAVVPAVDQTFGPGELTPFLEQTEVLVIAAPLTPQTLGLIGAAQIAMLPKGAVIVNVGRAKIIDTDALVAALHAGHLAGASLDVYPQEPLPPEHPLWTCPNVILTPHTSGFRQGHWDEVVDLFAENLERFERGELPRFRVEPELGY